MLIQIIAESPNTARDATRGHLEGVYRNLLDL
jgi:hypothetical protein